MIIDEEKIQQAVQWLKQADGILITAGAGMGVDSGLPDFRGVKGFWAAYPALGKDQINFQSIANQSAFADMPKRAWGFYGHRLKLYRETVPHQGFDILQQLGSRKPGGCFVYTSNVDGQFQKAGFDDTRIVECHGSIHHLQCLAACTASIWSADDMVPDVEEQTGQLHSSLPSCPHCGRLARPNILMFNDWSWLPSRTELQQYRLSKWLKQVNSPVVIELGAGTAIPSVRRRGESLRVPLIRINPAAPQVAGAHSIGFQSGALETLRLLKARLDQLV